ncbi:MAG TPA: hypothetical protein PK079_24955 [Leptospiraceae bacterium]|nr:hypothetical protein [Leptospiraceae bacterium]HMW08481.1 hypothetical protein [Leptospiraceae bacterium]HMX33935.1 hypothetical protein [Leptospiraceae bacterium]HMY34241.1 hypothetical protein [Leptospiraceae bacterium]HMZ67366.1 hypothetical protein [Leptospiraceae bacterium]
MKLSLKFFFIFLFFLQISCRTLFEIGNGNFFPYSGTAKNWKCITKKTENENSKLEEPLKLICFIDFPMSFAFDTIFLFITIPISLKQDKE